MKLSPVTLIEFAGGFITFLRDKEKHSESDQSMIGDIPIRSSPEHPY